MSPERFFADTNIFLHYLTNDIPDQAEAVEALLIRAQRGEIALVINALIVSEIAWVLDSFYKLARDDVRAKLLAIINTPGIMLDERESILQAIAWWYEEGVDFADAVNAAWIASHHLDRVFTFDRNHFRRIEGISVHVPGAKSA